MSTRTRIKRKHTTGRPSPESLATGEMCLVVPENVLYIKKDFENLLPINAGGTQCIIVSSFGTPLENGTALQAAYDDAKTRTPSATNIITIVGTPGTYQFPVGGFVMDTPYINLVSLDGNRSLLFEVDTTPYIVQEGDIFDTTPWQPLPIVLNINTDYVYVKGVIGKKVPIYGLQFEWYPSIVSIGATTHQFSIMCGDFPNIVVENCSGGAYSFCDYRAVQYADYNCFSGDIVALSGTFIDCDGGYMSFGNGDISGNFTNCKGEFRAENSIVSGTFTNCEGNFGHYGSLSGTFINCKGIFGYSDVSIGDASGLFINCTGFFAIGINASGRFINCKGEFASNGVASGTFINCDGSDTVYSSFFNPTGLFNNCIGGDYSFGGHDVSGTFNNCTGGNYSFGYYNYGASMSGTFNGCTGGDYSFGGYYPLSKYNNCTGGDYSFGYYGALGTFTGCTGGDYSFGGYVEDPYPYSTINVAGNFSNCRGGLYSFGGFNSNVTGIFRGCIGGEFSFGSVGSAYDIVCASTVSGTFNDCIGEVESFGGRGTVTALAVFNNCTSGNNSFGGTGTAAGKLYYCRLKAGTFKTVSGGGRTIYCIDGNNNTNNQ